MLQKKSQIVLPEKEPKKQNKRKTKVKVENKTEVKPPKPPNKETIKAPKGKRENEINIDEISKKAKKEENNQKNFP